MPLPKRSYGLPGTNVIPSDWGASHAPVAAGTMTATVALRVPGGTAGWVDDENGGHTGVVPNEPFATDVPARVQALVEGRGAGPARDAVDVEVQVSGYLVTLPLTGEGVDQVVIDGESNTLIDVTTSDDPMLTGVTLRVEDVVRGSLRFERDLLCTINN